MSATACASLPAIMTSIAFTALDSIKGRLRKLYHPKAYKPRPRNTAAITLKHSALLQIDDTPSIVPGDIPDNNRGTLQSW